MIPESLENFLDEHKFGRVFKFHDEGEDGLHPEADRVEQRVLLTFLKELIADQNANNGTKGKEAISCNTSWQIKVSACQRRACRKESLPKDE